MLESSKEKYTKPIFFATYWTHFEDFYPIEEEQIYVALIEMRERMIFFWEVRCISMNCRLLFLGQCQRSNLLSHEKSSIWSEEEKRYCVLKDFSRRPRCSQELQTVVPWALRIKIKLLLLCQFFLMVFGFWKFIDNIWGVFVSEVFIKRYRTG